MVKRVCFLVSEHSFLDARIFKKQAKSLLKQGYTVTMIVPRRKGYLFAVDGSVLKETFLSQTFSHEGINVVTYEQLELEKHIKALYHHLRSGGHSRFNHPLTKIGIDQKADIYHAHEFMSLYAGIGIKRALTANGRQCKLIYDSHELEPDPLVNESRNTHNIKMKMLKLMLSELDHVITVSESIKTWHRTIHPHVPIDVIYNSPPLAAEYNPSKAATREIVLGYEGTLNRKRGNFRKLIHILKKCQQHFPLKVKIIGGGKHFERDYLQQLVPHVKEKIAYTGWVNYEAIPEAMKEVDIGWIDLDAANSLNNRFAMPNKFFSYLNNGVPVIVNQCTDMENFIKAYNCGYTVKKQQATAGDYVRTLIHAASDRNKIREMGSSARNIMETMYSWEHMEKRLFTVYRQLS
ncbi:Glycosyltransferase involved in cell wall bisynthesis [Lentibacillus persicus]|uniref:Glycosyltransferase involved in cell wall bisynthesis n=1 Tax=Lentibacillus persicus TaxID=640948 RepID=A0A1I1YAW4_9BACI|nr:Glycosyltransferase involved in cell wall bisynthesis [Lentibacillus persicus]